MKIEKFRRESAESLVIVQCRFPNHGVALALDTGASHTTIDLTTMLIAGFRVNDVIRIEKIETAGGVVEASVFKIPTPSKPPWPRSKWVVEASVFKIPVFTALGITKTNIEVCSYDFFAHGVLAEFDGVLGLDFVDEYKICIDFKNSEITIQE